MDTLEEMIFKDHDSVYLDTSIPVKEFYLARGYVLERTVKWETPKTTLEYEVIKKLKSSEPLAHN